MEIGRIDHSVNIAEEQRSALKPNCTAKTWQVRGGRTGSGPCHDIILSLLWRTEPFKPQVQTKCKPVKHKRRIFDRLWLREEFFFLLIRASIFLKMGEIASASLGPTSVRVLDWLGAVQGGEKAAAGLIHNAVSAGGVRTSFNNHQSLQLVSSLFIWGRQTDRQTGGYRNNWRCWVTYSTNEQHPKYVSKNDLMFASFFFKFTFQDTLKSCDMIHMWYVCTESTWTVVC